MHSHVWGKRVRTQLRIVISRKKKETFTADFAVHPDRAGQIPGGTHTFQTEEKRKRIFPPEIPLHGMREEKVAFDHLPPIDGPMLLRNTNSTPPSSLSFRTRAIKKKGKEREAIAMAYLHHSAPPRSECDPPPPRSRPSWKKLEIQHRLLHLRIAPPWREREIHEWNKVGRPVAFYDPGRKVPFFPLLSISNFEFPLFSF